jgi:Ion transport protein
MWDVFVGFSILYSMIFIPFSIGFMSDSHETIIQKSLNVTVDSIFLMDILITFQTPYVCRTTSILVTDRIAIAKNYISFWFFIDFAASGPVDYIAQSVVESTLVASNGSHVSSVKLLRILRLARLAKLFRILRSQNMKDLLERFRISPSVMIVALLIFQIFLIAHILSCFWFFIATDLVTGDKSSNNPDLLNLNPTWTVVYGCDQYDTGSQYIISLFWTFQTLLSVGYGDAHPVNTLERAYGSLVMLIGCLMFGCIIAKVGGKSDNPFGASAMHDCRPVCSNLLC